MTQRPSDPGGFLEQARRLFEAGQAGEGRRSLRAAADAAAGDANALAAIAAFAMRTRDWPLARDCLEAVVAQGNAEAALHTRLGLVYHHLGRTGDAAAAYESALRLDAGDAGAASGLGRIALSRGAAERAASLFEQALTLDSDHADAAAGLGMIAENIGQPERALSLIEPLLGRGFINEETLRVFAGACRQLGRPEAAIGPLESLLSRTHAAPERASLLFLLAGLYDDCDRLPDAFAAAREGNQLTPGNFDPAAHAARIDALVESFVSRSAEAPAGLGTHEATTSVSPPRETPMVFIVGVPRSGTTLTEQILAQHPAVLAGGEHSRLERMAGRLEEAAGKSWPEALAEASDTVRADLARRYLAPLGELAPGTEVVTDKMPVNFLFLGLVAGVFPNAKVVWCRRDPLDVGLSCFMQRFGGRGVEFASDLSHIGFYIRQSERLMRLWRDSLSLPVYELQYETLVGDGESEARRLLDFLGLEWDEHCLRFHESRRFVGSPSYAQVRKPVHASAVGKHTRYGELLAPLGQALRSDEIPRR